MSEELLPECAFCGEEYDPDDSDADRDDTYCSDECQWLAYGGAR